MKALCSCFIAISDSAAAVGPCWSRENSINVLLYICLSLSDNHGFRGAACLPSKTVLEGLCLCSENKRPPAVSWLQVRTRSESSLDAFRGLLSLGIFTTVTCRSVASQPCVDSHFPSSQTLASLVTEVLICVSFAYSNCLPVLLVTVPPSKPR